MKLKLIALLTASSLLACVSLAQAQSVNFNVTGTITQGTCSFVVNSTNDVNLGSYGAYTFTGSTTTAPINIPILASGCTSDITAVHMQFNGTADTTVNTLFQSISTAGNVTGVAIELLDTNGTTRIPVNNATLINWATPSTNQTYTIKARFSQTKPLVTPGVVKSPITIAFTYN